MYTVLLRISGYVPILNTKNVYTFQIVVQKNVFYCN